MRLNGPAKSDDCKFIMVNSCVAFGCTYRSGNGVVFPKIPCDKQKLWLITLKLAKPSYLKHACVCSEHFLEEDCYPNYKMQSELICRSAKRRYLNLLYQVCFPIIQKDQEIMEANFPIIQKDQEIMEANFPITQKDQEIMEARSLSQRVSQCFTRNQLDH